MNEFDEDPELTQEQRERVNKLSKQDIEEIDKMLLSQASYQYRKVARIVGFSMMDFKGKYKGIPDVFFSERVKALVADNFLESKGNLNRMRFSEVCLVKQE